jgi:hypothetical protein
MVTILLSPRFAEKRFDIDAPAVRQRHDLFLG